MLRNLGIRSKILAVLAVPVVVLVLAATIIAGGVVGDARSASQVEKLAAQAPGLSLLVRGLQGERSLSLAVLSGDAAAKPQLVEVRAKVDDGLASVRAELGSVDLTRLDDAAQDAVAASNGAHSQLESIRQQVDAGTLSADFAARSYANVIEADVALPERVADGVQDRDLSRQLRAYSQIERLVETVARETDLGSAAITAGGYTPELRAQLTIVVQEQEALRASATEAADRLGVRLPDAGDDLTQARERMAADTDGVLDAVTADAWRAAGDTEIDALESSLTSLANMAGNRSAEIARDAAGQALQIALSVVVLVVLTVLLALFIARRITEPLTRLTEAAAQIRSELPRMVEQMQTPGEGPDVVLPDIPEESGDEVGRLAAAFNDVNRATIEVAHEQAALRGSIAAMFVNVARRDQVLLSRQLAFIDQLERAEEDPQTLENLFRLDHLATRMRRNAESLLVLAGIDTGRRLRRPMLLSDVVRTAFSEIEHYDRVDLSLRVDPPVVSHVALSAAHLVAELLENATRFSDPGSRVLVSTDSGPHGVVVTIADEGLGMTPDEIADANARIAEPPVAEVVGAQRLGFFVVGRLARKLDATVTLRAGAARGTIVTIDLGPALFVPGSVPELPTAGVHVDDVQPGAVAAAAEPVVAAPVVAEPLLGEPVVPEPVASERVVAERPAQQPPQGDAAPARQERTDEGLPKRHVGSVLPRRTPGATKTGAAAPSPAAAPAAVPAVSPASGGPGEPRSAGLFSGFRSRRAETREGGADTEARVTPASDVAPERGVVAEPGIVPTVGLPGGPRTSEAAPSTAGPFEAVSFGTASPDAGWVEATDPEAPRAEEHHTATGTPALTILPDARGRGRLRNRKARPQAESVSPMTHRELRRLEHHEPESSWPPPPGAARTEQAEVTPSLPTAPARVGEARTAQSDATASASFAPQVAAGGSELPTRGGAARRSAPAPTPVEATGSTRHDALRQRSALASEALTELSLLSAYSPSSTESKPASTLTRRTPAATPAAAVPTPRASTATRRARSASDVRSMLSGFQAGVERGRSGAETPARPADGRPSGADGLGER